MAIGSEYKSFASKSFQSMYLKSNDDFGQLSNDQPNGEVGKIPWV
jgi:hypothetical protein